MIVLRVAQLNHCRAGRALGPTHRLGRLQSVRDGAHPHACQVAGFAVDRNRLSRQRKRSRRGARDRPEAARFDYRETRAQDCVAPDTSSVSTHPRLVAAGEDRSLHAHFRVGDPWPAHCKRVAATRSSIMRRLE